MFVWPTLNCPHQSLLKRTLPPLPSEPSSSARLSHQVVSRNGHGLWSNTRLQTGLVWRMQVLHNCVLLWDSSLQTTVSSSRRAQPVRHSKPHWNVSSSEILTNLPDYSLPSASLWSFVVLSSRENFSARWKPLFSSSDLDNWRFCTAKMETTISVLRDACFSYTTLEVQHPPLHCEECFIALWNGKKYQASLWSSQKRPARLPPLPRLPREPLYGHMYGRFSLLCANTETSGPVTSGAKDWRQIFKENYQQDA